MVKGIVRFAVRRVAVVHDQVELTGGVDQVHLDPAVDLTDESKVGTGPNPAQTSRPAWNAASAVLERHANSKTLFNGAAVASRLCFFGERPTALAPGGGVQMAAEQTAHATS